MNWKRNPALNWKLYCIIDNTVLGRRDPCKAAGALFKAGADVIQLRYKNCPTYKLVGIAKKIGALASKYGKTLLINDRIDVASATGAKGVHLGSGDFSLATTRRLLRAKSIVGKTAHTLSEARKADSEKADYVSAGPVFSTPLKRNLKEQGIGFVRKIKKNVSVPVFAIGGINRKNIGEILSKSAANGVCVARAALDLSLPGKKLAK